MNLASHFPKLLQRFPNVTVFIDEEPFGQCPVQASGRLGREFWYFRGRNDRIVLTLSEKEYLIAKNHVRYVQKYGSQFDAGWISPEEVYAYIDEKLCLHLETTLSEHQKIVLTQLSGESL